MGGMFLRLVGIDPLPCHFSRFFLRRSSTALLLSSLVGLYPNPKVPSALRSSIGLILPWRPWPIPFPGSKPFSNMILATIRLLLESCGLEGNACFGTKVAGTSSKAWWASGGILFSTSMNGIAGDRRSVRSSSACTVTRWFLAIYLMLWWRLDGTAPRVKGRPARLVFVRVSRPV